MSVWQLGSEACLCCITAWQWNMSMLYDRLAVKHVCLTAWKWCMSVLYYSLAVKHVCVVWQLGSEACLYDSLVVKHVCFYVVWQLVKVTDDYLAVREACLFLCCMTAGEGDRKLPGWHVCFCTWLSVKHVCFCVVWQLVKVTEDYLDDYNQVNTAQMKLVLFMDAIKHVCRIARIIRQPLGNALLLGMGGSGRQSLTRLAAHVWVKDTVTMCNVLSFAFSVSQNVCWCFARYSFSYYKWQRYIRRPNKTKKKYE